MRAKLRPDEAELVGDVVLGRVVLPVDGEAVRVVDGFVERDVADAVGVVACDCDGRLDPVELREG